MTHTNTKPIILMELDLIPYRLFYYFFTLNQLLFLSRREKTLQLTTLVVLYHYINFTMISFSFFLLRKAGTTEPISGNVTVSHYWENCVTGILLGLNII